MIRIPAPYLRGLAVLTLGASFVLGQAALAAQKPDPAKPGALVKVAGAMSQDGAADVPEGEAIELAENCYLELQKDLMPNGMVVSRVVHECD